MQTILSQGDLVVIETDDKAFLGIPELSGGRVIVRSGYVGHPAIIDLDDIVSVTPASEHPDCSSLERPAADAIELPHKGG